MRRAGCATALLAILLAFAVPAASAAPGPIVVRVKERVVPLAFNHDCIAPALVSNLDGDCDGAGNTIVADENLPEGGPLIKGGVSFDFPDHEPLQNNTAVAVGQVIPVNSDSGYAWIHVLMLGNCSTSQPRKDAVITYADGKTQPFAFSCTDWSKSKDAVHALTAQNTFAIPNVNPWRVYLQVQSVRLKRSAAIRSIKLPPGALPAASLNIGLSPSKPHLQLLAVTLSTSPYRKAGVVFN